MSSLDANAKSAVAEHSVKMSTPADKLPRRRGVLVNLVVENADKVAEYLGKAVGAKEYFRVSDGQGKILHLALDIDDVAMYMEEIGHSVYNGPEKAHVRMLLNIDDPLHVAEQLEKAGAKTVIKAAKQFWGDIYGVYEDPFGVQWCVTDTSNELEEVPKEPDSKLVPHLMVNDADAYLEFVKDAFGAEPAMEPARLPNGKILWAEVIINGGKVGVADVAVCGDSTQSSVTIMYEVPAGQADVVCKAFEANGGKIVDAPSMQFWGQVWGRCNDAFGQSWGVLEPMAGPPPSKEEKTVDICLGDKYKWKWSWRVEDVPTVYCFGEVRTTTANKESLSKAMEEMIPLAYGEAAKRGIALVGPTISGYYTWDPQGETRLTSGPMVGKPSGSSDEQLGDGSADGGLAVRALGGLKCVVTTHVGPYEDLMKCFEATLEWITARGYESRMPLIEVYENSPEDTEPSKLRTKMSIPIVPKGTPKPTGEAK